jgi:hypothetical protein
MTAMEACAASSSSRSLSSKTVAGFGGPGGF